MAGSRTPSKRADDIAHAWLAESTGINRIATLDIANFSVYRISGRKRFELELSR